MYISELGQLENIKLKKQCDKTNWFINKLTNKIGRMKNKRKIKINFTATVRCNKNTFETILSL